LLQGPAFAIFGAEEFVGLIAIGEAHFRAVPEEFFHGKFFAHFRMKSDIAEKNDFGERAGPVEVRAAGLAAFAGFNPFFVMADGARKFFGRIAVCFGARFRNEFEAALALTAKAETFAFVTDEEMAVSRHFPIFFEFGRAGRTEVAVVPNEFQRRHFATCRKFVGDHGSERISFVVHASRTGLNAEWIAPLASVLPPSKREWGAEFKRTKHRVHCMAADVTECAGAEIPPAAPFEGKISGIIRARWRGAEPEIPIESGRNWGRVFWPRHTLRPIFVEETVGGTIGPDVDFADGTDGVVHDEFAEPASVFGSLTLIAHLGGDFMFARGLGNLTRFPDGVREGLFAIDVLAEFDGGH